MPTLKAQKAADRADAITKLRALFPPGSTVYTVLRRVARSGMSRHISVVAHDTDGPSDVTWLVARALDVRMDRDTGGLKVSGCGMDMGFHVAYNMSRCLYSAGYGCLGEGNGYGTRCPSNDHSNGDRDYTPHGHRKPIHDPNDPGALTHWHQDGGYALRHRWL